MQEYPVTRGQGPHDVAPARDGGVWYTAQLSGELGWLDPRFGVLKAIKLGAGSAPHGVIVGPDGAPWITDGGLNAIIRVDPITNEVKRFPLPAERPNANLNTAVFDRDGTLWFTGQNGIYGRLDPTSGAMAVFDAPRGAGPYGIAVCPDGSLYYASLAGSYVGRIERETGGAVVLNPPTPSQGARRVWCDSKSRVWVSEWNSGQIARYGGASWKEWKLPGDRPMAYAVFVDDADVVWISEWNANALVRFDPATETFVVRPHPAANANVRQLLGRHGEVWGAMSGQDKLVVARPAG
ncbi:MAG TPA: lyase [Verrucomicrobiae bacterium]|nr:lyase [Verrucomicrobiae bacterium]